MFLWLIRVVDKRTMKRTAEMEKTSGTDMVIWSPVKRPRILPNLRDAEPTWVALRQIKDSKKLTLDRVDPDDAGSTTLVGSEMVIDTQMW